MLNRNPLPWSRHLGGDSPWHRTDPRVRLFASLLFSALALGSRSLAELLLTGSLLFLLYRSSGTGLSVAWSGFRPFLFLLVFTALLQLFFTPGEAPPGRGGLLAVVNREGLVLSALVLFRLAAIILVSTHLITTTSPLELSKSLGWMLSPAGRLGLPVADMVLILNLGFQFFPIILEEGHGLRMALESRGISLRHRRLRKRLWALTAWILALLTAVIERSHRLSVALELKGCTGNTAARIRFPEWKRESTLFTALAITLLLFWYALRLRPLPL